jgi:hypothetical protein
MDNIYIFFYQGTNCLKNERSNLPISTTHLGSSDSLPGTWQSTTTAMKPLSHDRLYYFLPYWDEKPTMYIRSSFPDHRRRMYNSNAIQKVSDKVVCTNCINLSNFFGAMLLSNKYGR